MVTGAISAPGNNGEVKAGQTVVYSGQIGDGGKGDGEFEYSYGLGDSQPIFLRIWPDGAAQGKTYGETSQLSTSAAGDNQKEDAISSITCNRKLAAPPAVDVSVGSYALTYTGGKYLPSFVVTPTNASGGYIKDSSDDTYIYYTSIAYEITKSVGGAPDWTIKKPPYSSGSIQENDALNPYYLMGGEYFARAIATNGIGAGPTPSPGFKFTIPAGDGIGGPITIIYNLTKPVGKSGINTISLPFNFASGVTDEATAVITTVDSLIKSINAAYVAANPANTDAVTVFGWYDETTQTHVGLTGIVYSAGNIDASSKYTGAANIAAITGAALDKGRSYQVTVKYDNVLTYKLTGTVK
ncbi:MAG: hypothetical protein KKC80_00990 [Candidatus Margulisbacteria bacterium]|nr:hypothetical protein [Candidatus Margulisiibacteriota bacterium]MBU1616451.1 hypothetical protein [Candidatus Margulisiibacteriota bacterium]